MPYMDQSCDLRAVSCKSVAMKRCRHQGSTRLGADISLKYSDRHAEECPWMKNTQGQVMRLGNVPLFRIMFVMPGTIDYACVGEECGRYFT